jgi:hypothetical protein
MGDVTLPESDEVTITIDALAYRCPRAVLTGAEIRHVAHPPIGSDRDLWLVATDGPDQFLSDEAEVAMTDGVRLFTAPRTILAGAAAGKLS